MFLPHGPAVSFGTGAAPFSHTFHARRFALEVALQPDADFEIDLREDAVLLYQAASRELILRMGPVCGAGRDERCMLVDDGLKRLELYVDASTLEAFVNDGAATMTSRLLGMSDEVRVEHLRGAGSFCSMGSFVVEEA